MDIGIKEFIIAIVTTDPEKVSSGGAPVFYAKDEEERERVSLYIAKITLGMIHDLHNGCYIIVKH